MGHAQIVFQVHIIDNADMDTLASRVEKALDCHFVPLSESFLHGCSGLDDTEDDIRIATCLGDRLHPWHTEAL